MKIKIGSRKSKLAMWQTETVAGMLNAKGIETEIVTMETKGDKVLDTSIAKIGSKGVFTEELEEQLADGSIDIAVHSAKDMPSRLPAGFSLIAFTEREKANDVLVSHDRDIDLDREDRKIVIGTSSVRRTALLRHYYPRVETVDMRGNLQTRIKKMESGICDALILAYAGVTRMEYDHMIVTVFPETKFIPPVGQGCIAIEAASTLSPEKREKIREVINNTDSETRLLAERAFLKKLEGGCSIPAFALAVLEGDQVRLSAGLMSLDGRTFLKKEMSGPREEAVVIGEKTGNFILENGGREVLARIREQQD